MADNELKVGVTVSPDGAEAGAKAAADAIQAAADRITNSINSMSAGMATASAAMASQLSQIAANTTRGAASVQQAASTAAHGSAGIVREALVIAREIGRGDFTRLGGSATILAQRMGLLELALTPVGAAVTVVAGSIALLGVAMVQGALQMSRLDDQLVLTHNIAGLTNDDFLQLAQTMADASGGGVRNMQNALEAVAATGVFSHTSLQAVAGAVAEVARLSGESADKVAASFAKMREGVLKWAQGSTLAINNLTTEQLKYIQTLEKQGREQEAAAYASQKITDALKDTEQALGDQQGYIQKAVGLWQEFWSAAMNYGRPEGPTEAIQRLNDQLKEAKSYENIPLIGGLFKGAASKYQTEIDALMETKRLQDQQTSNLANATEKTAEANRKFLAEANKKPKAGPGPGAELSVARAQSQAELALQKENLSTQEKLLQESYANQEVTTVAYFNRRRQLIQENMELEIKARQQELAAAQSAGGHASSASQRLEAQAKIVQIQGQINLLRVQESDQLKIISAEQERVATQQQKELDSIKAETAEKIKLMGLDKQKDKVGKGAGPKTDIEIVQEQRDLENQRYQITMQGLERRLQIEGLAPIEIAKINAQIEEEQASHTAKLEELAKEQAKDMQMPFQKVADTLKSSFTNFLDSLGDRTKSLKEKMLDFVNSVLKGLASIGSNMIASALFGGGTGNAGVGAGGGLFGGALQSLVGLFGGAASGVGAAAAGAGAAGVVPLSSMAGSAALASFDVGTDYVPKTGIAMIHQGERIIPAADNASGNYGGTRMNVTNNYHFTGAVDNRTQMQIGAVAASSISRAMNRNG